MITEYFVCNGPDIGKLHEAVNQAIKNGWQPFGGVAMSVIHQTVTDKHGPQEVAVALFCQAVVKTTAA